MIEVILKYNYMQNAVMVAIFSSIVCGIVGTIIVEKKLVNMSGGIAHASFGGIGAGYFFGIEPIVGGLIFAVISSLSIDLIRKKTEGNSDNIVNMFWAAGMAIGILFISITPGYPPDMTSYLFGDILTVNDFYLYIIIGLAGVSILSVFSIFNYWKLYLFDEEYAKIMKINIAFLEKLLYVLLAISIVILIKVVGIILAIAMLSIPPATIKLFTHSLFKIMVLSSILGIFISLAGLSLSYYLNIPSGATIILISISIYFLAMLSRGIKRGITYGRGGPQES